AAARAATGTRSGGESRRRDGDEPAPGVQHATAAELRGEVVRLEHALVHLPERAVAEHALLPALLRIALARTAADDDELGRDATRLPEERGAFGLLEVAVEVAREDALEARVGERQRERVADEELPVRHPLPRDLDHRLTLIQPRDRAG